MSAAELRKAAETLRERAKAATNGPWTVAERRDKSICGIDQQDGYDDVIAPGPVSCMAYCYGGTSTVEAEDADWRYIALMHPGVGLAVADLLDHALGRAESKIARGGNDRAVWSHERDALFIARLINGEPA